MPTSFYDVVVIGDELAGAVAAALLARRGFRTLLVASEPVEHDLVGADPVLRAPLALTGLESPALKRVVNELNLLQLLRRRVEANHPPYQVLLPDHRIDVGEDLGRELARELPEDAGPFDAWLSRAQEISATLEPLLGQEVTLPPEGFWDRRDLKRIAAQLPPEDEHGAPLDPLSPLPAGSEARMVAALPVLFASDLAHPGVVPHARLGDQHRRGTWRLDGGREALRGLLHERIRTYSGEVRHDLRVRGLSVRRGRVDGVGVGDRDEIVGCTQVIAAMPAARAVELLPERPPKRLEEAAAIPAPLHRYRLHLVAPLEALPDALGPLSFAVADPAAPLRDANALALHVGGAGPHATIAVEALASDPSPAGLERLRSAIRAQLVRLLPFVDRHLVSLWSPHDALPPEGPGAPKASLAAPLPMDPLWDHPAPRALGLCGLPHASGVKQLYFASRQVLPGLGLEGELAAGWVAARLITGRSKRRDVDKAALLAGS